MMKESMLKDKNTQLFIFPFSLFSKLPAPKVAGVSSQAGSLPRGHAPDYQSPQDLIFD